MSILGGNKLNNYCFFFVEFYFSEDMEVPSLCKHESRRLEEIIMPPASFSEGNFQDQ